MEQPRTQMDSTFPSADQFAEVLLQESEWYDLGVYLGVSTSELREISRNFADNGKRRCLIELYDCYTERKGKPLSWETIATALRRMRNNSLADQIHFNYILPFVRSISSVSSNDEVESSTEQHQQQQQQLSVAMDRSLSDSHVKTSDHVAFSVIKRDDIVEEIRGEFQSLTERFALLALKIKKSFRTSTVDTEDLQDLIEDVCGLAPLPQGEATFEAVFKRLKKHCTIINFHPLIFLVENLLSNEENLQKELAKFSTSVESFKKSAKMIELISLIKENQVAPDGDQKKVKLKVQEFWVQFTMKQFETAINEILDRLNDRLSHITVVKGCICVSWVIPDHINASKLVPELSLEFVQIIGVISLHIGDTVIYDIGGEGCRTIEAAMLQAIELKNKRAIELLLAVGCSPEVATYHEDNAVTTIVNIREKSCDSNGSGGIDHVCILGHNEHIEAIVDSNKEPECSSCRANKKMMKNLQQENDRLHQQIDTQLVQQKDEEDFSLEYDSFQKEQDDAEGYESPVEQYESDITPQTKPDVKLLSSITEQLKTKDAENALLKKENQALLKELKELKELSLKDDSKKEEIDNVADFLKHKKEERDTAVTAEEDNSKKEGFDNVADFLKHKKEEERDAAVTAALSEGGGNLFQYNVFLNGAPGVGKTSLKRVMLGQDPLAKKDQTATDIVENAVRAITTDKIKDFRVIGNDELIDMLAKEVNSHHVVQESGTQGTSGIPYMTNVPLKNDDSTSSLPNQVFDFVPVIVPSKTSAVLSIKERLDRATGPVKIYDCSWHHVVDSGGQPQFTDILPLVYRSPSLNVVVVRLTEGLDNKPRICYYEEGRDVYSLPNRLLWSNRELIIEMCQIAASRASGGVVPYVMVVGTHLDRLDRLGKAKVLREFNQGLGEIRKEFGNLLICKSEDEIIFPINTMAEGEERREYTKELQECITSVCRQHVSPVKVPLRWLIYQLDLDREGGIARMGDCYKTGEALGMQKVDVQNALKFFSEMALMLYFPDDIPDLVFTKMDPLIGRLSKLVKSSFILLKFCPPAESERLRIKGLFNMSYLANVLSSVQLKDDLSNEEFVTILQCLKIAVRVNKNEYFLPSALSLEPIGEQSTFKMLSIPLVFSWGEHYLPHGFFFTVAVELLGRDGDYRFELCTDIAQWRQEIQVREASGKIPGVVKLTNKMKWIQVSSSSSTKHCLVIREEVNIAVQKSITRFKHTGIGQPLVTSLCPLCKSSDHYCLLSADKKEVTCTVNNNKTGPVSQEMSCWFQALSRSIFADQSSVSILPLVDDSKLLVNDLADVLRSVVTVSADWYSLGLALGLPSYELDCVRRDGYDERDRFTSMLSLWLKRGTASWKSLVQALHDSSVNRRDIAQRICEQHPLRQ